MSLLVTGSIGIDTVKTPFGISENCLGGSSVYFCMAASFFCPVRLVGVIGGDCPFDLKKVFEKRDVDLAGLEIRKDSKTFRWAGTYHGSMNQRTTDRLELNVLSEEPPKLPDAYKDSRFIFLANTAPALQLQLLEQVDSPVFVAADTMNCWIENELGDLKKLLVKIDCLTINEDEARMLAGELNLIEAVKQILKMGPGVVAVKKGEYGSLLCDGSDNIFILPAYPSEVVKDPTGAGDSFAGGFMGYLASENDTGFDNLKKAVAFGTAAASFTIEEFSIQGLASINKNDIDKRFERLRCITRF
jgi:sugar/nucleoside kinase (ribokinase family)